MANVDALGCFCENSALMQPPLPDFRPIKAKVLVEFLG